MFEILNRVGSVVVGWNAASLIADKFQKTPEFSELQTAVTLVLVEVSSKFKLFYAAFEELNQMNVDVMKKSGGVATISAPEKMVM